MQLFFYVQMNRAQCEDLLALVEDELPHALGDHARRLEHLKLKLAFHRDDALRSECEMIMAQRTDPWNVMPEALGMKIPPGSDALPGDDSTDPRIA